MSCPVCKKKAEHECPVCHKKLCEEHVIPENHKCKIKKKTDFNPSIIIIPLIVVIVIGALYVVITNLSLFSFLEKETINEPYTITVYENISQNISFHYNESYDNMNLTLYGFLRRKKVASGYVNSIEDDYGNIISLVLDDTTREVFNNADPDDIYKVTGILKKRFIGLNFVVYTIEKSERPFITIEKHITQHNNT